MNKNEDKFRILMSAKKYDVEHALGLYALSFYSLPAEFIYAQNLEQQLGEGIKKCHIYLIGIVPKLEMKDTWQEGNTLLIDFEMLDQKYEVKGPIPPGMKLKKEDYLWYLSDGSGGRFSPTEEEILQAFQIQHGLLPFEVVYVGQAFGKEGSRHAIDRLKKHETQQKIALKGVPDGYRLQVVLIETHPSNQMFTLFNPFAKDTSKGERRIKDGLDKLFGTNEHEQITQYEASFIRYFKPVYNIEFKNSFPSTDLKVLEDCYNKDFSSIVAEFVFDQPPFALFSQNVDAKPEHIIKFDLHKDEERKVVFSSS